MHLLFNAMNVPLTITRRDNPDLVPAISKINRKPFGDSWNTPDHWRILISYDHYTHVYRSLITNLSYSAEVSSLVSSAAGASTGAAAASSAAASSATSARVAATLAIPSFGSVINV